MAGDGWGWLGVAWGRWGSLELVRDAGDGWGRLGTDCEAGDGPCYSVTLREQTLQNATEVVGYLPEVVGYLPSMWYHMW